MSVHGIPNVWNERNSNGVKRTTRSVSLRHVFIDELVCRHRRHQGLREHNRQRRSRQAEKKRTWNLRTKNACLDRSPPHFLSEVESVCTAQDVHKITRVNRKKKELSFFVCLFLVVERISAQSP
ncbi:hypothetical protein AVEN_132860-1 [Araneus ventricosus]|uniref:Uncharacterized protein n=1 Tax=Araneus ventricosus TaxID=182803 RepID=A0A4Y2GUD6_ARAVE|nr:hypothetical protein AVEN_132860-1 [Araneus ventricosus]